MSDQARWRRGERTARTAENLAAIRELNEDGWSDAAIGRHLGIHAKSVWQARHDMGLPVADTDTYVDEVAVMRAVQGDPPKTITQAEVTEVVRILTDRGHTAAFIAERLNTTTRTVSRHRHKINQESA